jgi:Sec-independent protein secretion pathway component TatC
MVSETVHDLTPSRGGRLLTTFRDHWLALLVAGLLTTVVSFVLLGPLLDALFRRAVTLAGVPDDSPVVLTSPWSVLLLRAELAGAVGLAAVTLLATGFAFRDTPPTAGAGSVLASLTLAGLLFAGGVALGLAVVVPAVVEILGSGALTTGFRPASHLVWTTELVVFLPVVLGVALSLPAVSTAAVRGGVVRPRTLGSRWPVALLGAVLVAALFSPPDSLTFALYAGLLLTGYGAGTVVGQSVASGES